MLKSIFKRVAHLIYRTGKFEDIRLENESRRKMLDLSGCISQSAWIWENAIVENRSNRRCNIKVGERTRVMGNLFVFEYAGSVQIGDDCFVGPDTRIWSVCSIKVGNRVLISHNVNIHDNISHPLSAKDRYEEYRNFSKTGIHLQVDIKGAEVLIEDDVWIGFNATILRGVKIGRGAIIGAGSVVTKDVEPWTVNLGNPLRCVRKMAEESVIETK